MCWRISGGRASSCDDGFALREDLDGLGESRFSFRFKEAITT